jgi:hypothetical protein
LERATPSKRVRRSSVVVVVVQRVRPLSGSRSRMSDEPIGAERPKAIDSPNIPAAMVAGTPERDQHQLARWYEVARCLLCRRWLRRASSASSAPEWRVIGACISAIRPSASTARNVLMNI